MNNKIRKIFRKTHLVLGLATGLVVFIVAITGCVWVFKEEIELLLPDVEIEKADGVSFITPSQAKKIALDVFPGKTLHGIEYPQDDAPLEVIFYQPEPKFYRSVYLHPQTGEVLKTENHQAGFFPFILDGHLRLWLPNEIGSQIVSWSTLIFLVMLITGIVLWWPRHKKGRKQRLTFKWKPTTKWKRKNFDLHAITGFYVYALAFVLGVTGCVMAFGWFGFLIYKGMGGEKEYAFSVPSNESGPFEETEGSKPVDRLLPMLKKKYTDAHSFEIHYPHSDTSSIYVEIAHDDVVSYRNDLRYYDQRTLAEIPSSTIYGAYENAGTADKIMRMNYDIHIGRILGLPGKILAFLVALLIASLPVTGVMIWWGRNVKKPKKSPARKNTTSAKRLSRRPVLQREAELAD